MSRQYKNILRWRKPSTGYSRRAELYKEVVENSSPFPKPVTYEDIDREFKLWSEKNLSLTFEGEEVPTVALFTNQRFSEYMQTWMHVDDKRNMLLNFKIITRENNPKVGSINGDTRNIPVRHDIMIERKLVTDRNGRPYFMVYRMKQPIAVDFKYKLSLVTNKYALLNDFNTMLVTKFNAITEYMRPNDHFMSMVLDDISDESEYSIDDRQFYSQSFNITVRAYIISEDDFTVEEVPFLVVTDYGEARHKTFAEIEDIPCSDPVNPYSYQRVNITVHFDVCSSKIKFKIDEPLTVIGLDYGTDESNVRHFKISINGEDKPLDSFSGLELRDGDEIVISKVNRFLALKEGIVTINAFTKENIVDSRVPEEKIIN